MRRILRSIIGGTLVALLVVAPASAAPARDVTIDLHVDFELGEDFTATGFCESGTAESFGHLIVGMGRAITFHLFKTLTCDDGSGTLTIRVEASSVDGFGGTIGGWNVVGGTGDYASTRGGGHIVGTAFDGGLDDHYTGKLSG